MYRFEEFYFPIKGQKVFLLSKLRVPFIVPSLKINLSKVSFINFESQLKAEKNNWKMVQLIVSSSFSSGASTTKLDKAFSHVPLFPPHFLDDRKTGKSSIRRFEIVKDHGLSTRKIPYSSLKSNTTDTRCRKFVTVCRNSMAVSSTTTLT